MKIDPGDFHQSRYKTFLREGIKSLINIEGPISHGLVMERVKTSHGWKKAGRMIREVISQSMPKAFLKTEFQGEKYYWPENVDPNNWLHARYPNHEMIESQRHVHEVPPEEIYAIAEVIKTKSQTKLLPSQIVKEVAYFLGWSKCTARMDKHISQSLEKIGASKEASDNEVS